jgi:hypothetical protein
MKLNLVFGLFFVLIILLGATGCVAAQDPQPQGTPLTTAFAYQGQLQSG